jgi:hypothetical protein
MTSWLDPIRTDLDRRQSPVTMFIRDDDAGWGNECLLRLLAVTQRRGVPIDVAAIPDAIDGPLARTLRDLTARADLVSVHQHGRAHCNHECNGRKSEFGEARSHTEQHEDIRAGQERLRDLLGEAVDRIFTPPWNRCTEVTVACLESLGFRILSRDVTAPVFESASLAELPIQLDWTGRRGRSAGAEVWGATIAARLRADDAPIGLMLHHAAMTDEDFRLLDDLLRLLAGHAAVKFASMSALAGSRRARGDL